MWTKWRQTNPNHLNSFKRLYLSDHSKSYRRFSASDVEEIYGRQVAKPAEGNLDEFFQAPSCFAVRSRCSSPITPNLLILKTITQGFV